MQSAMVHNRWKEWQFEPYDDEEYDNVVQCGGHTQANRSTEACSCSLQYTSSIMVIGVMVSEQKNKL